MFECRMFDRLFDGGREDFELEFEGELLRAREGDSVAAVLLAAGVAYLRTTPVSDAPRGVFCMMGVCFECLVEIDGEPNRQACMVEAAPGMRVRRMRGARGVASPATDAKP